MLLFDLCWIQFVLLLVTSSVSSSFIILSGSSCSAVKHKFQPLYAKTYDVSSILDYSPDKEKFDSYFKYTVGTDKVMNKAEFASYEDVVTLVEDGLIFQKKIDDMWISRAVSPSFGLSFDEAYDLLCQIIDSPNPDDMQIPPGEFNKMAAGKAALSFSAYITSCDIEDMINEKFVTLAELAEIWTFVTGGLDNDIEIVATGRLTKIFLLAMNKRMNSLDFQ